MSESLKQAWQHLASSPMAIPKLCKGMSHPWQEVFLFHIWMWSSEAQTKMSKRNRGKDSVTCHVQSLKKAEYWILHRTQVTSLNRDLEFPTSRWDPSIQAEILRICGPYLGVKVTGHHRFVDLVDSPKRQCLEKSHLWCTRNHSNKFSGKAVFDV